MKIFSILAFAVVALAASPSAAQKAKDTLRVPVEQQISGLSYYFAPNSETLALQTATAIENARLFERTVQAAEEREWLLALHQEVVLARARLENEMTLAARIQADLFPASLPSIDGLELAARNKPARRCGGDYYDALTVGPSGDERLLLCVADVGGEGGPGARRKFKKEGEGRGQGRRPDGRAPRLPAPPPPRSSRGWQPGPRPRRPGRPKP